MRTKVRTSKIFCGFLSALLILTLLSGCGGPVAPDQPVNVNYGISEAWDSLMPYHSVSGSNYTRIICDKIYDRLVYIKADGSCLPRGAESWESADEGYAIVFHLNPNAKFHDGTPVTAHHWADTMTLLTNPECPALMRTVFSGLAGVDDNGMQVAGEALGVEALDDLTLKLSFQNPVIPEEYLLESNRNLYVLPTHLLEGVAPAQIMDLDLWKAPIGSGPLKFVSEISGSTLVLEANQDYQLGAPGFDTLTIQVIDKANQMTALIAGDLDYYTFGNTVSEDNLAVAQKAGLTVVPGQVPNNFFELMLNNESIPQKEIRRAIALSLDKALLAQQNAGSLGEATHSTILPGSLYAESLTRRADTRDLEGAKALLEGIYDGRVYTLACTSSRAGIAALIQQQLAEAGIAVEIETVDAATLFSGMFDGLYDMAVASHTPASPPLWFVGSRFHSDNNLFRVQDLGGYEARISAIQETVDLEERLVLVHDLELYLQEEMPFVPLWFTTALYAQSPLVEGIDYPAASFSNENLWDWKKSA